MGGKRKKRPGGGARPPVARPGEAAGAPGAPAPPAPATAAPSATGPTTAAPAADRWWADWRLLLVVAAAVVACVPVWLPRYFPCMDGPQHVLFAHMRLHFADEAFGFARFFTQNPTQISPILGDWLLRAFLALGLSPPLALKALLTLWIAGTAAAAAWAASWRRREGVTLAVAALLTVPGIALGMGFVEFLLSLPLALAALGVVLRGPALGPGRLVAVGVLALASILAHPFTLVVLLPALAAAAWATGALRPRLVAALLPAVAVGTWAFFAHVGAPARVTQPTVWAPFGDSLRTLAFEGFGALAPTGLVGLVGTAALLGPAAVAAARAGGRASRLLLGIAALYAVLTVATPSSTFNWALFHHRFVPLVWLVALAAAGGAAPPRWLGRLGLAVALVALVAQVVVAARVNLGFDTGLREYVAAAAHVPRASRLLPLNFDPRGASQHRLIRPYLHAWAYVMMERGGMTPYVFATHPEHAFHFRDRPKAPTEFLDQSYSCARAGVAPGTAACRDFQQRRLAAYASRARAFDAVLAWSPPAELRPALEGAGLAPVAETPRAAVYRRAAGTPPRPAAPPAPAAPAPPAAPLSSGP
jgi:hypothetical protein